jgi:hypothetical protein
MSRYIPAGRTSEAKRRGVILQVQTEYASRPAPRITTTILDSGRVIHKIENRLERMIESLADQELAEKAIKVQHSDVLQIIRDDTTGVATSNSKASIEEACGVSTYNKLLAVQGVKQVFHLDNEGNFVSANASAVFQQTFKDVFGNIRQIIDIFVRLPETEKSRERGVYEINRGELYLASDGDDCYFVVFGEKTPGLNCEQVIKAIIDFD